MKEWISANRSIARHPLVRAHAREEGATIRARRGSGDAAVDETVFLGWGRKASGRWAAGSAEAFSGAPLLLEDGFVRSLSPGSFAIGSIYSLVADTQGIYYDARSDSDLLDLLRQNEEPSSETAQNLERFRELGASKYNCFPDRLLPETELERQLEGAAALIIDQTRGDQALVSNGVNEKDFRAMFERVVERHPRGTILIRSHPDALLRSRASCFDREIWEHPRVRACSSTLLPADCFRRVPEVHVMNSLLGLEAVLHGVEVHCHTFSFYSGRGLTHDSFRVETPRPDLTVEQLFHASHERYSRYFDPVTQDPCGLDRILDHLELQLRLEEKAHGKRFLYLPMPRWKRRIVATFLGDRGATEGDPVQVRWGTAQSAPGPPSARPLITAEDGFLRSLGLGLDFHRPLSLALDARGIYYDSTRPSDLEILLETGSPTPTELAAATGLIERIRARGVTKYNLVGGTATDARPIDILVVGQVEGDASLRLGSPEIDTNLGLLKRVRLDHPDASIGYKPHPDVEIGHRPGRIGREEILRHADLVVDSVDLLPWIESAGAVAVMTSLAGFEALLRQTRVLCYGQPFYAGWGLTTDLLPCRRRTRRLELAELVHGALVAYPRYVDPLSGEFLSARDAVTLLSSPERTPAYSRPLFLRAFAAAKTWVRGGIVRVRAGLRSSR